jgi:four helix bundle protein
MARVTRFEKIDAWKKGRDLRGAIYTCSREGAFAKDFALRDQIRCPAVSITSNIAEGFECGGNKEFIHFLADSKGSCGELRDQLYAALDEHYISADQFDSLCRQAVEISRMISGLMTYLKRSGLRGAKFKPLDSAEL